MFVALVGHARRARVATLLLAGLAPGANAARFGIPTLAANPPGYFILSGPDAASSLGDKRHALELWIEVAGTTLDVGIYDPGLISATAGNLDFFYGVPVGTVTYTLFDGSGTLVATQTHGSDIEGPGGTNLTLVPLYSGPALPGRYRLVVNMDDSTNLDRDFNGFGVSVPGYDLYSHHFTGGEANLAAATIREPLIVYPWMVGSTPGIYLGEDATGVDVISFDLDSTGAAPPTFRLQTPSGRGANMSPSVHNGQFTTSLAGLDRGLMDCSDYGIYELRTSDLSLVREGTDDYNVFTSQLVSYQANVQPADFPIASGDSRGPVRLYYPRDDDTAPIKESLTQTARVLSGASPPEVGFPSVLEITLTVKNLTAYPLTAIDLQHSLSPSAELTDPANIQATGGLGATAVGRTILITGDVAPGVTATVTYETTIVATSIGVRYVTGDGTDLQGGTLPTNGTYLTPFANGLEPEYFGPICMLRVDAKTPTCSIAADIQGDIDLCAGDSTTLSAAGTVPTSCSGAVEYRWFRNAIEIYPYPAPDTIVEMPAMTASYTVEARCATTPTCLDQHTVTVNVRPSTPPTNVGNTLRAVRENVDDIRFTWTTSGPPEYHLRRHDQKPFDRPSSTLIATTAIGDYLAPGQISLPDALLHYRAFSFTCVESNDVGPEPTASVVEPAETAETGSGMIR